MSNSQVKNISWILLLIPHASFVIIGLIWIINPIHFMTLGYETFVGKSISEFIESSARHAALTTMFSRTFGAMLIVIGAYAFSITLTVYRKGEKWSWFLLLGTNTFGLGFAIFLDAYAGIINSVILEALLLIIVYVGLLISAKSILSQAKT
jgi:hypothetical protein